VLHILSIKQTTYNLRTILLTKKELQNKHSDAIIIIIIFDVLFVYVICNRLKYSVIHKVIINNTVLKAIVKKF